MSQYKYNIRKINKKLKHFFKFKEKEIIILYIILYDFFYFDNIYI